MNNKLKAFVLMPFDPEFKSIYEDLIKPALEEAGYEVARADSFFDQQNILRDIIRGIAEAELIVADLTTINSNVLYELGVCHGLQIPTIILTQSIEEVPFDLRPYRMQIYSTRFDEVKKIKDALKEIGKRHINKEITFGSPVTDFLPKDLLRIMIDKNQEREETGKERTEGIEEEKGFIDFIIEGNQAAEGINRIMEIITAGTKVMGDKMRSHTTRIKDIVDNPGPDTPLKAKRISSETANDMNLYSEGIENELSTLGENINILIDSYSGYLTWLQPETEEDKEALIEFRKTIYGLQEGIKIALNGTRNYHESIGKLKGISRDMNQASRRMHHALEGIISSLEIIKAFCARTIPLIDERIAD